MSREYHKNKWSTNVIKPTKLTWQDALGQKQIKKWWPKAGECFYYRFIYSKGPTSIYLAEWDDRLYKRKNFPFGVSKTRSEEIVKWSKIKKFVEEEL